MEANLVDLGERITEQAAHLDAAMHRLLTDLREFDRGGGWEHQGFRSCAQWMAWRLGWALGTSREHVRVANRLDTLPLTDDALRLGKVSYSKIRAMTRVATPANEGTLLAEAGVTTATQLESICRKYSTVLRHENGVAAKDHAERRHVTRRDLPDGMVRIQAVLHPEEAALVWAALDRIATERCREHAVDSADDLAITPPDPESEIRECQSRHVPGGTADSRSVEAGASPSRASSRPDHAARDDEAVPAGTPAMAIAGMSLHDGAASSETSQGASGSQSSEVLVQTSAHSDDEVVPAGTSSTPMSLIWNHIDQTLAARGGDHASEDRWSQHARDTSYEDADSDLPPSGGVTLSLTSMREVNCSSSKAASNRSQCDFDRADALVAIAEDMVRGTRRDRSPIEVIMTVTSGTLACDRAITSDPSEVACFSDGTCVSAEAARRLSCDAGVVTIVEDEHGNPLSAGRKVRTISGSMKRALLKRDRTCRFPGCTTRVFLEGHHMKHWADGGATDLQNIVSICSHHHRFVHEYGYSIELDSDGSPRFIDDRSRRVLAAPSPARPPGLGWEAILESNRDLAINSTTNECGYDGNPIDYGYVIEDLVHADKPDEQGVQ